MSGSLDFSRPWLWPFLAAALIPWLLYLLDRYRAERVAWPAIDFFLAKGRRRVRWLEPRELALLAVRTGALAMLVIALMQPAAIREAESIATGPELAPRSALVIAVDTSFSMTHRAALEAPSALDDAKRAAIRILESAPSDATIALIARPGEAPFAIDAPRAIERIRGLEVTPGSFDLGGAIDDAIAFFARTDAPQSSLIALTDLQLGEMLDAGRAALLRQRLDALAGPMAIRVVDCAAAERSNTRVVVLRAPDRAVGAGERVEIAVAVATDRPSVEVIARSRDAEIGRAMFAADDDGLARGTIPIDSAAIDASHRGELEIALRVDDPLLEIDNERYAVVRIVERLDVLIVESDGTGTIEDALWPRAPGRPPPQTFVRPRSVAALDAALLDSASVLILAELDGLDARDREHIESFVERGGGLLVFAGSRARPDLARALFRDGRGVLPARLESFERAPPGAPWSPRELDAGASIWSAFRAAGDGDPRLLEFSSAWTVTASERSRVAATSSSGASWIVTGVYGRGRTALVTTGIDARESDLMRTPLAPPLIHELVKSLAPHAPSEHTLRGPAVEIPIDPSSITSESSVNVTAPDGRVVPATIGGSASAPVARWEAPLAPGHWTIETGGSARSIAINVDPAESDLTRFSATELDAIAAALGATVEPNDALFRERPTTLREESSLWAPALGAALALFLAELGLLARFGVRIRRAPRAGR